MTILKVALEKLWHLVCLLFFEPRSCALCSTEIGEVGDKVQNGAEDLCPECYSFFSDLSPVRTSLIGDDEYDVIECFSGGYYSGPLQEAVYQIKYLKRPELARILAFSMLPPAMALLDLDKGDSKNENKGGKIHNPVLVPVPLHPYKQRERGFNQAEELAAGLGHLLRLKVDNRSLIRTRPTRPQFGLSRSQRRGNLQNAFKASPALCGQEVILIDDVLTSGATIYECAQSITCAGGVVVGAVTLARARWQKKEVTSDKTTVPAASLSLIL